MAHILVVDDEPGIRDLLSEILNDEGHSVDLAENAAQARTARASNTYDLVLLDIWMPDTDGVTLLKEWAATGTLDIPVIMMSGHASIDTAVEATRIGAKSFLEKPITLHKLIKSVEDALEQGLPGDVPSPEADSAPTEPTSAQTGPDSLRSFDLNLPLREARDVFEKAYFEYHLASESGSMTRVAEKTGLERTHLYRKLRQLGINLHRIRRG